MRISNRSPFLFCVGIDGIERTSERKAEPPSEVSAILQKFPLTWALSHLSFARRPNSMKEWKLRVTCTNNKCVWWSDWMKYFRGPSAGDGIFVVVIVVVVCLATIHENCSLITSCGKVWRQPGPKWSRLWMRFIIMQQQMPGIDKQKLIKRESPLRFGGVPTLLIRILVGRWNVLGRGN